MATRFQVTFDCADPDALAGFWAAALGYQKQDPPEGFDRWEEFLAAQGVPEDQWSSASAVVDPDGLGPRLYFQQVPEAKVAKNRVHLDVNVGGGPQTPVEERRQRVDAEAERLIREGAKQIRADEEHGEHWVVMQDPEGNEFCLQ
jgi:catechol 2,3-dioxygenase-like lactoylglutathione lyase family enzyme